MIDYPASHSMDTTWFAVDADGHVAAFETGENGHAPDGDENDLFDELVRLLGRSLDEEDEDDFWEPAYRCEKLGLYLYDYSSVDGNDFDPIAPYDRSFAPGTPLHIDQLPPRLRERARETAFSGLCFAEAERIQPMEYFSCVYWYEEDRIAYLCSDGKTVKPIPGQEGRFAAFVRDFRTAQPDAAARLRFEGPLGDEGSSANNE